MYTFACKLIWRSVVANWSNSLSAVLMIAVGCSIFASSYVVHYWVTSDPLPGRSDFVYAVKLDSWSPNQAFKPPNEPPPLLTHSDALALAQKSFNVQMTFNFESELSISQPGGEFLPFLSRGLVTTAKFFSMFGVPFLYGAPWQDLETGYVIVLNKSLSQRVFGKENSIGEVIWLANNLYTVIGITDTWHPIPKFYDAANHPYGQEDKYFIPFMLSMREEFRKMGGITCWKQPDGLDYRALLRSECVWIQGWALLNDQGEKDNVELILQSHLVSERELGRFPRPDNNRLVPLSKYLEELGVFSADIQIQNLFSALFATVCIINAVILIFAKLLKTTKDELPTILLGAKSSFHIFRFSGEFSLLAVLGAIFGLLFAELILSLFSIIDYRSFGIYSVNIGIAIRVISITWAVSLAISIIPIYRLVKRTRTLLVENLK